MAVVLDIQSSISKLLFYCVLNNLNTTSPNNVDYDPHIYYTLFRLDFGNLKDLPILVLDVNDDFKNDRIKQQAILDKVRSL